MARPIRTLELLPTQRQQLERLSKQSTAPQRLVRRAHIILERADGLSQEQIAWRLGINRPVVVLWEKRFRQAGLEGLNEARRSGRKPSLDLKLKEQIYRSLD